MVILLLGLALTGIAVFYSQRQVATEAKKEFASVCNDIENKIYTRLHAHAQLLRSGSAFFAAKDTVTRRDWKEFAEHLNYQRNLPGIQGLGFSLIIPKSQLQQHIRNIRKEGFPDYAVWPEGERDVYTSVIFLEPFSGRNLRAFGYDTYSEPIRRKAMELSRDSGLSTLTGKVHLVQETNEDLQTGTLMYIPVYRKGMPVTTTDQRRAAVIGWVYSPYRMNDLMDGILGRWDLRESKRIHLQIYDDTLRVNSLLYDSQYGDRISPKVNFNQTLVLPVEFHGKKWILSLTQSAHESTYFQSKVIFVLIGGILISLLLFLLSLSLFNTRYRAMKIARNLTFELKESEAKYRMLFENMEEGFSFHEIITDEQGRTIDCRLLDANAAYERHSGLNPHDCIGKTIREIMPQTDINQIEKYGKIARSGESQVFEYFSEALKRYLRIHAFSPKPGFFATIFEDISEQKLAEEAIRLNESRFRAILDNSYDAIGVHFNGVWEMCNPAALRLFGVSSDNELIGKSILNVIAPNERTRIHDFVQNRINEIIAPINYVTIGLKSDGTEFNMDVRLSSYKLENKLYVLVILRDITESLQAEEVLKESEARFRNMADTAPVMLWKSDADGLCDYFNKPWLDFTGRTLEQEMGHGWAQGIHPDDYPNCLNSYFSAYKERHECRIEYRLRRADGQYRWLIEHGVPRFNPDGTFAGFIGSCVDITKRKEIETEIETLSLHNQTLLQTASDGIHVLDYEGNVVEANQAFCKMLGYSHEELLKLHISDWDKQWPREELVSMVHDLIAHPAVFETRHRRKDGTFLDVEVNCAGVKLEDRNYLYASSRDITDRKLTELQMVQKNEELRNLNAEKDKFFSIIAHDLRSPFNGFLGLTQIMVAELPFLTQDELQQMAISMKNSATNLFRLLENLLEWSRMKQGLIPYNPQILKLFSHVNESISFYAESAKNKGITIVCNIPENLIVFADRHILQSVVRNLVSNGIKFTNNGGIITLSAYANRENDIEIAIRDTGIGMNKAMIDNLFRLDINTSRKGTENEPSTGLGLIICKDFIEKNGGKLWIESEEGKGSTFRFTLPTGKIM